MRRAPIAALAALVREVWTSDDPVDAGVRGRGAVGQRTGRPGAADGSRTEHLLPSGRMHVVFRHDDAPLHLIDPQAGAERRLRAGPMLVGGVRARYYVREIGAPSRSTGFVLQPGAPTLLLGAPAGALADRHTPLDLLWGPEAGRVREQLLAAADANARLAIVEAALLRRLRAADRWPAHGPDPAIVALLPCVERLPTVAAAVRRSGLSHRHFIARFREGTGLSPATWRRVRRFQQTLQALAQGRLAADDGLAAVAAAAGYSDQAHFNREFRAFTGVTPAAYRRAMPADPNHLAVAAK